MHDARRVGRLHRVGDLNAIVQGLRHTQAALRNQIRQGFPGHQFHHHEIHVILGEDFQNGDDVGVFQTRSCLRLPNEPAPGFGVGIACRRHCLDRHQPFVAAVLGFVDIARLVSHQFFQNLVMRNRLARHIPPYALALRLPRALK